MLALKWIKQIAALLFLLFLIACNGKKEAAKEMKSSSTDTMHSASGDLDSGRTDIDPVKMSPGIFKVLLENQYVRVVAYTLQPGQKDDWHTHPAKSSYVVEGGRLKVFLENGETIVADEKPGTASWMGYVGKHYVENIGRTTVKIVYTEVKDVR